MNHSRNKADKIIRNHVIFSMGAGAIPFLGLDFIAVTGVQYDMIKSLANLYDQDYTENFGKALIASITGTSMARIGASAIKAIPGVGTLLGGVSMAITSGASTYALGNAITYFMERGISLEDIDEELARKIYEEELEKGKQVAKDLKNEKVVHDEDAPTPPPPPKAEPENDVYAELMRLGELKEKNIITEEEFVKMKKDIIDKF